MLESLVANILNRTLGSYVENFDPKQLNIGIWSGDVKLRNLVLKKESLEKLELPVDVKFGHLGELTLQIPWSNLKAKPVKVIIEDAYLLASPRSTTEFNEEEDKARELRVKKQKLEALEVINKSTPYVGDLSEEERAKNESFTESLVTKIVDNLQVTIKRIHFRYEDDHVFTQHPYALGFTLEELSAVSADANWIPGFITGATNMARKLLTLKSMSCYLNTESETIYTDDHDLLLEYFKQSLADEEHNDLLKQYILKPVSGHGQVTVNKQGATEASPHHTGTLFFDEFSLDLDSHQYRDILWTASQLNWHMKTQKFRKLRPKVSVGEDPKQWLQFAVKSVYNEIHERNYKWTWDYFKTRRDQRKAYIALWISQINQTLTPATTKELDDLEVILPYEDIKFYRSLARMEYRKEHKSLPNPATAQQEKQQQGWISSWWKSGSTTNNEAQPQDEDLEMTEEQRKELYDAIEFDEKSKASDSFDIPRERVISALKFQLKKGSMAIRDSRGASNIAEVIFEGCDADFFQRKDSFYAGFKLEELKVEDGSDNTLYKRIVSVKPLSSSVSDSSGILEGEISEPFFQVSFENNPLDQSADSALLAKMNSMTIFHNPQFIESVAKFFTPPKVHLDTIGMIMTAAESTINDFTKQTKIGLQYAFEEHKTLNCKMDLQAPLIIIPVNPGSWSSPVAVLDAGHISIVSDLADKAKIEEIKSERKDHYTDDDWSRLNTYLYDRFDLVLQDAQILIGSNIKSTIEQLHSSGEKPAMILDHMTMKFLVEVSIIPTYYNLPRIKIGGDVPRLKAMVNDFQYKIVMELINTVIPDFDFSDDDDELDLHKFHTLAADEPLAASIEDLETQLKDASDDSNSNSPSDTTLSSTTPTNGLANSQHLVEFNFNMDLIVISLNRCNDSQTLASDKLVDLVGENLRLKFYKTANGLNVDLLLADLSIEDYIEVSKSQEFKKLISSKNFEEHEQKGKKNKDLFKVEYSRTQRLVPHKGQTIEVFDQKVDMNIADFKVVITRKSLLTLLNFALNTFTDPDAPELPADMLRHNNEDEGDTAPQHIDVNMFLESIVLVLNDDGIKLATMTLQKADISIFMLPEKMKVGMKLGGLSLLDEVNEGASRDSALRQLMKIQGNELAELYYETYDPATNKEPYSSSIKFETGSIVVMFVEEAFTKIYAYLSQFQRMKYIYDKAREAALDRANNIEGANQMKFDILIRAPILIFPSVVDPRNDLYDNITINLGELYAVNEFVPKDNFLLNMIDGGLRNTLITSSFHTKEGKIQDLEMIDGLDVGFKIDYCDDVSIQRPSLIVTGGVTGKEMILTELQTNYMLKVMQGIPRVFASTTDIDAAIEDIEQDATNANFIIDPNRASSPIRNAPATTDNNAPVAPDHIQVDLDFNIPLLSLTLYNQTQSCTILDGKALSRFSLNDVGIKLEMKQNGNFKSDLHIKSFIVQDVREDTNNKFTDIIPDVPLADYQFMASVVSSGVEGKRNTNVNLAVDSPKVILALDYLMSLKEFADFATSLSTPTSDVSGSLPMIEEVENDDEGNSNGDSQESRLRNNTTEQKQSETQDTLTCTISVVDPSIILLASPQLEDSEAIVFKINQFMLTSQDSLNLNAIGISMFLCKMDAYETNRLKIIDEFSASFNMDSRGSTSTHLLSSIDITVDPLLVRVSLRDIKLALGIFNSASTMYSKVANAVAEGVKVNGGEDQYTVTFTEDFGRKFARYAPSILSSVSHGSHRVETSSKDPVVLIKAEQMTANIEGFRLVLIGDVHELPVMDMEVKPFLFTAKNWSTDLEADSTISSLINIFNYSTSAWEPLLEPWSFALHVSKITEPSPSLAIDVVSRESAEFTVSSRSIALLSHISSLITDQSELKPRGEDAPYRIINQTGYDINIWIDDGNVSPSKRKQLTLLKYQQEIPWSFEDWRKVRETLNTNTEINYIGVELINSVYNPVRKISLRSEGEELFMLSPKVDNEYHNRLDCEIHLSEEKVKYVILKSTITIQNYTQTPIHIGCGQFHMDFSPNTEITIPAGGRIALPLDHVYNSAIAVRPEIHDQKFSWSRTRRLGANAVIDFNWRNIMKHDMVLECPRADDGVAKNYFFRAHATYDSKEVLTQIYPHMTINISPPLEIENLLPYDINWKVFQKGFKTWSGGLKRGDTRSVHVVDMNAILMLYVKPLNSKYSESEAGFINTPGDTQLPLSKRLTVKGSDGQRLHLGLHYVNNEKFGLKISIYSPYLILNRTSKDLYISDRFNTLVSKAMEHNLSEGADHSMPDLFSFDRESGSSRNLIRGNLEENRAVIRVGDSQPSSPISIDKIGQSFEVVVTLKDRELENNVGIHITEGEGKYMLTKVINITPRYVVRNSLPDPIQISRLGASNVVHVDPFKLLPLYEMPKSSDKQLMVSFAGINSTWSAPFGINDIGEIYLRMRKHTTNQYQLVRAVISTEGSSIFIDITDGKDMWPYSIRNFSDTEFLFYQSNPNVNEDGSKISNEPFKPLFYRIPPKSVMQYAWDYPAAQYKELVLRAGNKERYVQLAEIGTLVPMKIPATSTSPARIVDLNVIVDGTIQCLVISNYDPKTSLYQLQTNSSQQNLSEGASTKDKFETLEKDENYYTKILLRFEGFGISLINTKGQELCYTTVRGVELRYNESDIYQNITMKLKWIQVDNQLYPCIYPIILYPTVVPKSSAEMNDHPAYSMSISRLKDETHGINYIKYATLLLQEMSIEVDEDFLYALLDFSKIPGAAWNKTVRNVLWDESLEIPEPPTVRSADDLYFEALHLQPLQFNLSFVRTERMNADESHDTQNALTVALNVLTMAIGNINDAPVRLSSLFLENIRTPLPYLISNITEHYQQAFLYQIYKVLGSADVLGNPVGLFNNISSGVMDIFYEPYQGFIMTDRPQELGIGLAKGSLSFVKKSVFGLSDSFARFTGSMAKGLTAATMDKNFQERRRLMRQRNKPKHPMNGFASGATSLMDGFSSGLMGIATAPIEGANREGAAGFFKGIGKGLIGLPTKTATGVFDFANNISEGIRNTATAFDGEGLDKVRLPRFINFDGSITPYSERDAQGQFWLKTCEGGKYSDDKYLAHVMLPGQELTVVISLKRIAIISVVKMTIEWELPFERVGNITLENSGIRIKQNRAMAVERFIPVPDSADRRFLYNKIAVAVSQFNKRCMVAL
ncbi:hypothetical protein CANARDRAFT_5784 [[Candida] arabinofermentans NRRL YB-2248]|uniref:Vacuolar protein sorting-associated protein n=1 Tax=[Candida] arabinofermentans NRRL YB-2248 TaxID=983967 RepID=A0A1E4T690_9ASCO|nr:hypothetical protein CANARDRAFT_5784 [[Candida] arabinofermentans NRRL YB-2248]